MTKPPERISTLRSRVQKIIDGKLQVIGTPWIQMDLLTQALFPGTITVICGSPSSSKSFMLLQALQCWLDLEIKSACYMLEESMEYHLMRALAQMSRTANMTDIGWVQCHPNDVANALNQYEDKLHTLSKSLFTRTGPAPTCADIGNWVEMRAQEGCRVICVDPITIARPLTNNLWIESENMLDHIHRVVKAYDISALLVTHPHKKFKRNPDMSELAGGAAYTRFCQSIFWLHPHPDKIDRVMSPCGAMDIEHNRTLHILKTRNGRASANCRLAFYFDPNSLTLDESGIIVKKKKG